MKKFKNLKKITAYMLCILAASAVQGCSSYKPPAGKERVTYERVYDWSKSLNLRQLEHEYGLPKGLLSAVMHQESAGKRFAVSRAGAKGLFQFMPATAREFSLDDPSHPEASAQAAAKYLGQLYEKYDQDLALTLAAYNWGMGNVSRYLNDGRARNNFDGMPAETKNYIARVRSLQKYYSNV